MADQPARDADAVRDLLARLDSAATKLDALAQEDYQRHDEMVRITGKAQGVRLALGYAREMLLIAGRDDG